MKVSSRSSPHGHRTLAVTSVIACAVFLSPAPAFTGSFIFDSIGPGLLRETIFHPIGYTGNETNQVVTVTFGIRPGTMFANEMRFALLNATETWTALQPTTGNLDFNSNKPSGQEDFETVLLHEIGHALGLDHPNMIDQFTDGRHRFTYSGSGPDLTFDTVLGTNDGADGIAGR